MFAVTHRLPFPPTSTAAPQTLRTVIDRMDQPSPEHDVAAREQCLRNSDIVEEILDHITSASDSIDLATTRRTLFSVALTCKGFSPSAVKFLWRRLDNMRPLLRLLPSFRERDGVFGLFGSMEWHEWGAFDRHAAFVQEIVYESIRDWNQIDGSVYVRLALRRSPILPNLVRFKCTNVQPMAAEWILYMQSPLHTLELYGNPVSDMTTAMIVSSVSGTQSHISNLILNNQPFGILSEGIPLQQLTSLELKCMRGEIDAALYLCIGALPYLRSFTADVGFFHSISREPPATHPESYRLHLGRISKHKLFLKLIRLHLCGSPGIQHSDSLIHFLRNIGAENLQFLTLQEIPPVLAASPIRGFGRGRGLGRGSGAVGTVNSTSNEGHGYLDTIARRWSHSLRELDFHGFTVHAGDLSLLRRLSALRSLKLSGTTYLLPDSSVFTGSKELEFLSLHLRYFRYFPWTPVLLDVSDLTNLAQKCTKLQEVELPISARELPLLSSTPALSHSLSKIRVHSSDKPLDTIALARNLDRLFPRLNSVVYDASSGGGTECQAAWAEIEKLVFVFQDVRCMALAQR
ncbi:hypothetical protein B0H11DRAFT_756704 [Mycena galericulata]|nr:hypothetical protein B0H11DRAFT_756704 [Mycena galericulata]